MKKDAAFRPKDSQGRLLCMRLPYTHVYKKLWEVAVGEELECKREPSNLMDRYAIAVVREGNVIGHLP